MLNRMTWMFIFSVCATCMAPAAPLPAFPGAQGFGSTTPGGRGGDVIYVENLNDDGPGSLREAVRAKGQRMVLFSVAGTIELRSPLKIDNPFITIAGQSAPGGGVCLKNYYLGVSTHDVVIRYLRVRVGDESGKEQDAVSINDSQNVVIDHCSVSWSIDECLSVSGDSDNVTVQWCFITESLNDSIHSKGEHGYGSLLRTTGGHLSFHHNLYAHHNSRNPRPGGAYDNSGEGTLLDFRNNLIYDWGGRAGYSSDDPCRLNLIANYYKPGPSTSEKVRSQAFNIGSNNTKLYFAENEMEGFKSDDQWAMVGASGVALSLVKKDAPFEAAPVETMKAKSVYDQVLFSAGATQPARDAVDERIVEGVRSGGGGIIDSQNDVGGWPVFDDYPPFADSDSDGMPDAWETRNRFNPDDPADGLADRDGDGYTNLEEYLNDDNPDSGISSSLY
ncbi:MAG: pectate lyase [bacterium]|nr:pectate lyase [bacterium]